MFTCLRRACTAAALLMFVGMTAVLPYVTAEPATTHQALCACGSECQCGDDCTCQLIALVALANDEHPQLSAEALDTLRQHRWITKIAVRRAVRNNLPAGMSWRERRQVLSALYNDDDVDDIVTWLEQKHGDKLASAYSRVGAKGDGTIIRAIVDAIKELLPLVLEFIKALLVILPADQASANTMLDAPNGWGETAFALAC